MVSPSHSSIRKQKNRLLFWVAVAATGVTILAAVLIGAAWLKNQITHTEYTASRSMHQIVVGNDVLNIPANLMRFEQQRQSGSLDQADIVLLWPSGEGYSRTNAQAFQAIDGEQRLIFVSLTGRDMELDMSGRLEPIYLKLFAGKSTAGPAGLRLQEVVAGKGYDGERLAIFVDGQNTWVARCQNQDASTNPTCLRDFFAGHGLTVRYRFPLSLLQDWREIETLVNERIKGMIAG